MMSAPLGADDAPFGTHDQAKGWRNMWQAVTKNFLLCGSNCSESHPSMSKYCRHLIHNIAYI